MPAKRVGSYVGYNKRIVFYFFIEDTSTYYSARLYRAISPQDLSGIKAVFCMCLYHPLYIKVPMALVIFQSSLTFFFPPPLHPPPLPLSFTPSLPPLLPLPLPSPSPPLSCPSPSPSPLLHSSPLSSPSLHSSPSPMSLPVVPPLSPPPTFIPHPLLLPYLLD